MKAVIKRVAASIMPFLVFCGSCMPAMASDVSSVRNTNGVTTIGSDMNAGKGTVNDNFKAIEKDIESSGTTVQAVLQKYISDLDDKLQKTGNQVQKQEIASEKDTVQKLLSTYVSYTVNKSVYGVPHSYAAVYPYTHLRASVSAVIAWFRNKGYNLSATLLTHAVSNNKVNSYYTDPPYGGNVIYSNVYKSIRRNGKSSGTASFPASGNTNDMDLYYAIHAFDWHKEGSKFVLTDRYDFALHQYDGIAGIAINTMYEAQLAGVIKPYILMITVY